MIFLRLAILILASASVAGAATLTLSPTDITEWKAVQARVESRDIVPARARIGGVIEQLSVSEGDLVSAGQEIGLVKDDKIAFQIAALDAQLAAFAAQLDTAIAEFQRGETLVERGVVTRQRLAQLSTDVEVTRNQIAATEASRAVLTQQESEGAVVAPADGRVLTVPASRGSVIMPGEPVATIGSGGFFLRLAVPERFAGDLQAGAEIRIATADGEATGRLAKIYPQIDNGRVIADVEVDKLDTAFVNARLLVEVPIGSRSALLVPMQAVVTRHGIDFISVEDHNGVSVERSIILGAAQDGVNAGLIEVISGVSAGDRVVLP
ncbi:efflux RND transporter periplasmic adaptor subunit [Hoeflea sp. YIM 152468]|uniref:efflux RND transporter periplasmic adaptor subunit n=1 Tax=Hoeflea sp. YIM 152468 TaxID=3031759 RepID=UPI0023DAB4D7|nr:efflux RND transporter periplasmic adaptor subunit [Hoeflea sp. YIM 152468]MDF1608527.1 efflux RND transporter periplasmic adaptor subunit [Hoeflea sp. YIM 152468]